MKLLSIAMFLMLGACGGSSEKEYPPMPPPAGPPAGPGGSAVTFRAALPIIQASCWGSSCHNQARPAGGVSLADYGSISKNLAKGLSSVSAGRMPAGGKSISAADIKTLREWGIGGYRK